MFTRLTRVWRLRWAGVLAVLYLACVLAPSLAFALGDASRTTHCLTDGSAHIHHKKSAIDAHAHDHADGTSEHNDHQNGDPSGQPSSDQQCCGLFCVTSFTASVTDVGPPARPAAATVTITEQGVTGNGPGTLYRPPIAPLSI
jgi:hypothetical protein